jgi:uncharacterized membrane protein YphA (DoxX/SURF4 family)
MFFTSPIGLDALALSAVFAASGLLHLAAPAFIRDAYERWHFPPKFHRVTGVLNLIVAIFLAIPVTRIWGAALAGFLMFFAVVTLLNNRQYGYSLPAMLLLAALVPVTLAGPI